MGNCGVGDSEEFVLSKDILIHDWFWNVNQWDHGFLLAIFNIVFLFDLYKELGLRFVDILSFILKIDILVVVQNFKAILVQVLPLKIDEVTQAVILILLEIIKVESAILGSICSR